MLSTEATQGVSVYETLSVLLPAASSHVLFTTIQKGLGQVPRCREGTAP